MNEAYKQHLQGLIERYSNALRFPHRYQIGARYNFRAEVKNSQVIYVNFIQKKVIRYENN